MKTTILQLEEHDDFVSVRDRLAFIKSNRVVLVWPEKGEILNRLLDLVLLQRAARQEGQQLGLVTRDPEITKNAEELGIPVFRNQKRSLRGTWRRKPQKMRLMRVRKNFLPPANELRKIQPRREYHPAYRGLRIAIFTFAILSILGLVLFLIPAATVFIPLEISTQEMSVPILFRPDLSVPALPSGVPVIVEKVVVEEESEVSTSGWISLPDQSAQGEVILTNLSEESISLPKGTVVLSFGDEPIRFRVDQSINLAAGVGETITVQIKAETAGISGNVPAESIQAVEGQAGTILSVINPTATFGGTNKTVRAPSQGDIEKLQRELEEKITTEAAKMMKGNLVERDYLIPQTVKISQVIEEIRIPEEGQPGDTLRLQLTVEVEGWEVNGEDILTVSNYALDANLPDGMAGLKNSEWWKIDQVFFETDDSLSGYVLVKRNIIPIVSQYGIVELILGKRIDKVESIISDQYPLHEKPNILIVPKWWPWMPLIETQIRIEW